MPTICPKTSPAIFSCLDLIRFNGSGNGWWIMTNHAIQGLLSH